MCASQHSFRLSTRPSEILRGPFQREGRRRGRKRLKRERKRGREGREKGEQEYPEKRQSAPLLLLLLLSKRANVTIICTRIRAIIISTWIRDNCQFDEFTLGEKFFSLNVPRSEWTRRIITFHPHSEQRSPRDNRKLYLSLFEEGNNWKKKSSRFPTSLGSDYSLRHSLSFECVESLNRVARAHAYAYARVALRTQVYIAGKVTIVMVIAGRPNFTILP